MTQVFYIEPKLFGPLPTICRATKCLADPLKNSQYCEKHQYLIKPPLPAWHKKRVVYIVGIDGEKSVKIGYSSDLKKRISALQTGNSKDVTIIAVFEGSIESEKLLHKELIQYNIRGEWYYSEVVKKIITDLVIDLKLRKSFKLGKTLALSDKIRYSITNDGESKSNCS